MTLARPQRSRRVCGEPAYDSFAPGGIPCGEPVFLTVDEYEVIRLVDFEKRTHEQCAAMMEVSRTTVTEIYESARFKLAEFLVNGRRLSIGGGSYHLCDGSPGCCGRRDCRRRRSGVSERERILERKGECDMRIAVTYENGEVFQHFGHTGQFKFYDVEGTEIVKEQVADTEGNGHGALAGFLKANQVDTVICGGIGGGAQAALSEAGIRLYGGVSGSADAAVAALLAGTLGYDPDVHCDHHEDGHHCHSGSCGEDKHGCAGHHSH